MNDKIIMAGAAADIYFTKLQIESGMFASVA
jgi:hypothetical protein